MVGYNYSKGMSNNAVFCYENGMLPKSKITATALTGRLYTADVEKLKKYKISLTKLRDYLIGDGSWQPKEWHHTSKLYNQTDFYDLNDFYDCYKQLDNHDLDFLSRLFSNKKKKKEAKKENKHNDVEAKREWLYCTWEKWERYSKNSKKFYLEKYYNYFYKFDGKIYNKYGELVKQATRRRNWREGSIYDPAIEQKLESDFINFIKFEQK